MVNATATDQAGKCMRCTLTHIALHVQDLEACVAFYQAYAGLRRVHERSDGGKRIVWLAERGREPVMRRIRSERDAAARYHVR